MTTLTEPAFDALLPPAMAAKAEQAGVNKASLETPELPPNPTASPLIISVPPAR